jgi:hypothetical protein
MSDTVLDSKPIPLGHGQTIRRYFELIRPQISDMNEKKAASNRPLIHQPAAPARNALADAAGWSYFPLRPVRMVSVHFCVGN